MCNLLNWQGVWPTALWWFGVRIGIGGVRWCSGCTKFKYAQDVPFCRAFGLVVADCSSKKPFRKSFGYTPSRTKRVVGIFEHFGIAGFRKGRNLVFCKGSRLFRLPSGFQTAFGQYGIAADAGQQRAEKDTDFGLILQSGIVKGQQSDKQAHGKTDAAQ